MVMGDIDIGGIGSRVGWGVEGKSGQPSGD